MTGVAPLRAPLLTAVTSGASQPIDCSGYTALTLYVTASAALSAGTIIYEEADWDKNTAQPYGGTWSQIGSNTLSTTFSGAGGQVAIHFSVSAYAFVRARIGTGIVGGTVTAVLRGHE